MQPADLPRAIALVAAGSIDLTRLISSASRSTGRRRRSRRSRRGAASRSWSRPPQPPRRLGRDRLAALLHRCRLRDGVCTRRPRRRRRRSQGRDRSPPLPQRCHRRAPAGARRGRRAPPGLGAPGPRRLPRTLRVAVPTLLADSGVDPADVIGIGIDFTACTMLPTTADGTPLCASTNTGATRMRGSSSGSTMPRSPRPTEINARRRASSASRGSSDTAARSRPSGSSRRRSRSCDEAPDVYAAADRLIEAADWVVWQLTGVETRNSCTAGYKAIWSKPGWLPGRRVLRRPRSRLRDVVDDKMSRDSCSHRRARRRAAANRRRPGPACCPGPPSRWQTSTPTCPCPAATVTEPGTLVAIMGTSICHVVLARHGAAVAGCAASSRTASSPASSGSRPASRLSATSSAGSSTTAVPPRVPRAGPRRRASTSMRSSSRGGSELRPGRVGAAGARLVERQPLGARRCRPVAGSWSG